jgi:hypothetical protein
MYMFIYSNKKKYIYNVYFKVELNKVDMEQVYFHHDNLVTNRGREISFLDWFLISKNIKKYISIKMRS